MLFRSFAADDGLRRRRDNAAERLVAAAVAHREQPRENVWRRFRRNQCNPVARANWMMLACFCCMCCTDYYVENVLDPEE